MKVSDLRLLLQDLPGDIEVLRSDSEYGSRELRYVNVQFKTDGGWTHDSKEEVITSWFGHCQDEEDEADKKYRKEFEESIQKVVVLG